MADALRRAQGLELAWRPSEIGPEAANAEAGEIGLQAVDDACALSDQDLTLAAGPSRILVLERGDRRHAAMLRFAAQPAEKGALEQLRVEPIRLRPSVLARHRDARRVDHIGFDDWERSQRASQKPSRPAS